MIRQILASIGGVGVFASLVAFTALSCVWATAKIEERAAEDREQ